MYQDFQLYIDGEWVSAKGGATKQVFDPANEDEIGKISDASSEDLDRALSAAEAGFAEWKQTGTWERAAKIRKVADLIRDGKDVNYEGAGGSQDFDQNGDVVSTIEIWKVEGGQIVSTERFELP